MITSLLITRSSRNKTGGLGVGVLRKIVARLSCLFFLLLLSLNLSIDGIHSGTSPSSSIFASAHWIDPDTPTSAHKTRPRRVPGVNPNQRPWKPPGKKLKSQNPTFAPSDYPTLDPTPNPTIAPTEEGVEWDDIYHLVMSDEFNVDGRQFQDGQDPKWTALDKNDYTNEALHYYTPDNVETSNGDLTITTEAKTKEFVGYNDTTGDRQMYTKYFQSAMMQTWNKFCFTGGIVEAEIELPGVMDKGGLWPAFWLLGNMARHTYVGSTNHVWPWSSNACTEKSRDSQKISGCKAQHYGLESKVGRGAPEIDIFEVQTGTINANEGIFKEISVGQPFMSASYQVAPGRANNRPGGGWWPGPGQWYEGLRGGTNTSLNILFYGNYNHFRGDSEEKDYWSDAISFNHQLDERHFSQKFKYRLEWGLPDEDEGTDGYIRWYVNDEFVVDMNGTGIVDAGLGSTISTEPMYLIMNTAVSSQWGFPAKCPGNCPCKKYDCNSKHYGDICGFQPGFCDMMTNTTDLPKYKVNYVRVYQDAKNSKQKVGCSTPERPSSKYIQSHMDQYKTRDDDRPLKHVLRGKGACILLESVSESDSKAKSGSESRSLRESCGGPKRGECSALKTCVCHTGWTGPHCLVPDGFNSIDYERRETVEDLGFTPPKVENLYIWRSLLVIALTVMLSACLRRQLDEMTPVEVVGKNIDDTSVIGLR
mmetsp:Transcript_4655/g.6480  ORF Transcript_4655/g.6480 Transcript_4655/m.6480 type:complete len:703 (-) Transcript_4655:204-2312(-)